MREIFRFFRSFITHKINRIKFLEIIQENVLYFIDIFSDGDSQEKFEWTWASIRPPLLHLIATCNCQSIQTSSEHLHEEADLGPPTDILCIRKLWTM